MPREWGDHFATLAPARRRAFAVELCREVVARAGVHEDEADRSIAALAHDQVTDDRLRSIGALVSRFEGEYDSLADGDESGPASAAPEVEAASRRILAAWALRCALEGNLGGLAYYAWFVLEDLDEIRRLAGLTPAEDESA